MRWLLLLAVPMASAGIVAVVPDLSGPGPGDEGFALSGLVAGTTSWTGWSITDGETTWHLPDMPAGSEDWFYGNAMVWAARDGPTGTEFGNALRLGNDGDSLTLLNPEGSAVSSVAWGDADTTDTLRSSSPDLVWRWDGDGDAATDWITPRTHRMGESNIPRTQLTVDAITTYVSPDSSFEFITALLDDATHRLALHVYELRSQVLADRIADVAARGVQVDVLVENRPVGQDTWERHETARNLQRIVDAGGRAWIADNDRYRHHHLKVLIVDDTVAIQSENWVASGVPVDPSWGNRGWGIALHGTAAAEWFWAILEDDRTAWDTHPFDLTSYDPAYEVPPRFATPTGSYAPRFEAVRHEGPFVVTPVITPEHTADPAFEPVSGAIRSATERAWVQQLDLSLHWTSPIGWSGPDTLVEAVRGQERIDARAMAAPPFHADDTGNAEAMASLPIQTCTFSVPGLHLHNKGVIADDTVYVGSMNGNQHSRSMNREIGVLITDSAIADYYAEVFLDDWQSCDAVDWMSPAPLPILLLATLVAARRWNLSR